MTKYLMIQGTASHVGKSTLVTALCKIFADRGIKVAPFKAQNMSLNSWVTKDGFEIGIAQAIQAKAAGLEPEVDMNPVLLKPKGDMISQVVVLGKPYADRRAGEYYRDSHGMLEIVKAALHRLSKKFELIIIEGAGGTAEINLYDRDIVNMRVAKLVKAPVILVGDIERGGVFASLYGSLALLRKEERKLVKGLIINKFRGDLRILEPGLRQLERLTKVKVLGVIPYSNIDIPSEDSVSLREKKRRNSPIEIAVIKLPRISNFTDFEPLEKEVSVRYVGLYEDLGNPDAIIIPGTKNTIADLQALREAKMDAQILNFAGKIPIIGICGGYQMLGEAIVDEAIEGDRKAVVRGLGLLPALTRFERYEKQTKQVRKKIRGFGPILGRIKDRYIWGYEIHMGVTETQPKRHIFGSDGCIDDSGLTLGTYLHGLFENEHFRLAFLQYLKEQKGCRDIDINLSIKRDPFKALADLVRCSVDIDQIFKIAGVSAR
ncbi:MAG: cobyric acid synthase [Methanocellales archaeon]